MTNRRQFLPWAIWAVAATLLALGGSTHAEKRRFEQEREAHALRLSPATALRGLRAYLANDWDLLRAHSYASALLGRPYSSAYVKPRGDWEADFRAGVMPDPDAAPIASAGRPLIPYRDFWVEYPPGFFLFAVPPALVAPDAASYRITFSLLAAALLTAALVLVQALVTRLAGASRSAWLPAWAAVCVLALGPVVMNRSDAPVAFLVTAAVWAAVVGRPGLSGAALGLAIATKLLPVVLLPPLLLRWARGTGRPAAVRGLVAFGLAAIAPVLPFLATAGLSLSDALGYQSMRPLQIETSAAAVLGLLHAALGTPLRSIQSFGSLNLQGPGVGLATALTSIQMFVAVVGVWLWDRKADRDATDSASSILLPLTTLAALAACFVTAKVFSPQYLLWLLPLGVGLSRLAGRLSVLLLVACLLLSQLIFPISYDALSALAGWAFSLVAVRNILLVVWVGSLVGRLTAKAQAIVPSTRKS
jgi:hypothetical protein